MSNSGPNVLLTLLVPLIGLAVAGAFAVYGCSTLARHGVRRSGAGPVLRGLAGLAAAASAAVYVWGAGHLVMDESMLAQACRAALGPERAAAVDGYEVSYLPPRLGCRADGDVLHATTAVPGYVNPAWVGLALAAVALGVLAGLASEYRTRAHLRKESSS
ncbi:hypothetical protein [Streptomyces sp. URMC 123]|uniref:hypothetical protein n=1 Tax=Streptomyces sp. URMC 123 TaxID=3423403 RepID=UPI003F1AF7F8